MGYQWIGSLLGINQAVPHSSCSVTKGSFAQIAHTYLNIRAEQCFIKLLLACIVMPVLACFTMLSSARTVMLLCIA